MALAEGSHTITAVATNATNTTSSPATRTFMVDTTVPAVPTITNPVANSTTDDTPPTFTGTAEPGSTVTVKENNATLCVATTDANGAWTCTPSIPLSAGVHTVSATATDKAGNTSAASGTRTFSIGSTTLAVAITSPVQGATITDRTPRISGTATPNITVTVVIDPDNNAATTNSVTYQTQVGADGTWAVDVGNATPTSGTLPSGGFAIGATMTITATVQGTNNTTALSAVTLRVGAAVFLPITMRNT